VAHQFARDWAGRAQRAVEGRQRIADVDGLAKKPKPIEARRPGAAVREILL
jgi:hypothetical protein